VLDVDQFKTRLNQTAQNTADLRERRRKDWIQLRALCVASELPEPASGLNGNIVVYGPDNQIIIDGPPDTVYYELLGPANTR
jgi:hypothetical protein